MHITFIGVGEAFDETLPNCSALVTANPAQGPASILLDCGFSAPFSYWRILKNDPALPEPMDLDAVWISHFHGDHFLGLPALLLRFHEEGRNRPLIIAGQPGVAEQVLAAMDMAYPGTRLKFPFAMEFVELTRKSSLDLLGFTWRAAQSEHPRANLSLRLDHEQGSLFYSGDGRPTPETRELAQGVDLVVHESFSMDLDTPGHGTVPGSLDFARAAGAKTAALVHVRRDVRAGRMAEIKAAMAACTDFTALLPEPGESMLVA